MQETTHSEIEYLADVVAIKVAEIMTANQVHGRWLTLDEAKTYARVKSINTIKKWIDEGYIYAFKSTGNWKVDRKSIDVYFESDRQY